MSNRAPIRICAALGAVALTWIALSHRVVRAAGEEDYASPIEIVFSPDGSRLYVLCQQSEEVRVLDAATFAPIAGVQVGRVPRGLALSHDAARLYVTNSWDDTLTVIDTRRLAVEATWNAGAEPSGVVEDREGKRLYIANRISNDVTVLDAATGAEEKRLLAGRGASYLAISPDGSRVFVTHVYPDPRVHRSEIENRTAPESEITVIDAVRATVADRMRLGAVAGVFHVAVSADGRLGAAAAMHPKNTVPLAHLEHGGAFGFTLTVFGADVGLLPVELPLDELERYASRPFGVVIARDKSRLWVTCGGAEAVLAIDVPKMLNFIRTHRGSYVTDLGASSNYVAARIPVGHDPRGLALAPDGRTLVVANRLDDTLSVIDTKSSRVLKTVKLDGPEKVTPLRRGEQTFYTSRYSFQGEIGCATCHIDSTFDGLQWDLEPDGFGRDIVDNKVIEDIKDIAPYKWNGGNPNIPTECGPRTEMYFWRSQTYDDLTLTDLTLYIRSLPPRPNRFHHPGGELTPAEERGLAIFTRGKDKFGGAIPEPNRCTHCHSGPKGTNQQLFDVGTGKPTDNSGLFKTPQLVNIALSAPYLHDGSARTLEEIWTVYNPRDKHGRTNDLTKDELNDLIEYLRTR